MTDDQKAAVERLERNGYVRDDFQARHLPNEDPELAFTWTTHLPYEGSYRMTRRVVVRPDGTVEPLKLSGTHRWD